jgi:hypothetical protein
MSSYSATLKSFLGEMILTFPEQNKAITRAAETTGAQFWRTWEGGLDLLLTRNSAKLFEERKGFLVGGVRLTTQDWVDISENTRKAIWKYLRTLTLEAAMEQSLEGIDTEKMQKLMDILTAEKMEADPVGATSDMFEESMKHMSPLMEKLKNMMGASGFDSKAFEDFKMPEIPEHLRHGRIAKMAEEMAKQFDPKEFGIDPALLKGDNVEEIFKGLADMYQRDPSMLIAGAKNIAEKIKKQILGGSLKRDELITEAQEFITLFKEHPQFKDIMSKVNAFAGPGGIAEMFSSAGGGESEPSERRRAVQERLRKKLAARKGGK